jgi:transposase
MSQKESKRLHIIRKAVDKCIRQREAAQLLDLSQRQIRRLIRRVREESDKGIVHRSRGKPSHRAIAAGLRQKILSLCRGPYAGFSPTFASEKLFERNKIKISREALRQWFRAEGVSYQKRKARPHRQWRERKHHCGEMVQMDGSHHAWFEDRGKRCVLIGYVDDATSRVYARFYEREGTFPAMDSFKRYALKYGLPVGLYLDRHAAYQSKGQATIEEELAGRSPMTQFARALDELGVRLIYAHSAPAKGRIERLFKTLQDRLIKEMRLRNIKSLPEANRFLGGYLPVLNKRFGVIPLKIEDLHRPLPEGVDLGRIFSVKTPRTLRNDFTVVHEGRLYQIEETIRADKVIVEERLNGTLLLTHKGRPLRYRPITQRPVKEKKPASVTEKPTIRQTKDNPWRLFRLSGSNPTRNPEEALVGAL